MNEPTEANSSPTELGPGAPASDRQRVAVALRAGLADVFTVTTTFAASGRRQRAVFMTADAAYRHATDARRRGHDSTITLVRLVPALDLAVPNQGGSL